MNFIESAGRIIVVSLVILVWILMFGTRFAVANDDDNDKPKPKPPVVTLSPAPFSASNDRRLDNFLGAAAFSGLATTALRDKPNGSLLAFSATVVGVSLIEAGRSDSKMSNIWWGVGGAAVGTIGTCRLLLQKNFIGCAFSYK